MHHRHLLSPSFKALICVVESKVNMAGHAAISLIHLINDVREDSRADFRNIVGKYAEHVIYLLKHIGNWYVAHTIIHKLSLISCVSQFHNIAPRSSLSLQ